MNIIVSSGENQEILLWTKYADPIKTIRLKVGIIAITSYQESERPQGPCQTHS